MYRRKVLGQRYPIYMLQLTPDSQISLRFTLCPAVFESQAIETGATNGPKMTLSTARSKVILPHRGRIILYCILTYITGFRTKSPLDMFLQKKKKKKTIACTLYEQGNLLNALANL